MEGRKRRSSSPPPPCSPLAKVARASPQDELGRIAAQLMDAPCDEAHYALSVPAATGKLWRYAGNPSDFAWVHRNWNVAFPHCRKAPKVAMLALLLCVRRRGWGVGDSGFLPPSRARGRHPRAP